MIKTFLTQAITFLSMAMAIELNAHSHGHHHLLHKADQLSSDASFSLRVLDNRLEMKYAEGWQAGLWPNPLLSIEVDSISLSRKQHTFQDSDATIAISQLIELGGKRTARQNVVAAEAAALICEREAMHQKLAYNLTLSFNEYIQSMEKFRLTALIHDNESSKLDCLSENVATGKTRLTEQRKAQILLHKKKNDLHQALGLHSKAKNELEKLSYLHLDDEKIDCKDFITITSLQDLDYYLELLPQNAELGQKQYEQLAAYYRYFLQKALTTSDLEVRAGVEKEYHIGGCQLLLEVSFALPVFNRNQGSIAQAAWEGHAAYHDVQDKKRELEIRCRQIYDQLSYSLEAIDLLKDSLIPKAQELIALFIEIENEDKQTCADRLDAITELYDLELLYIDALKEYHDLMAELNLICGITRLEEYDI